MFKKFGLKALGKTGFFARPQKRFESELKNFYRDESGSLLILTLMIFIVLLLMTGMGVDFVRQETARIRLQNTLDRAILAAADLDQTLDPATVVNDYFEKAGMAAFVDEVHVEGNAAGTYRIVTAKASVDLRTRFLRLESRYMPDWEGIDVLETAAVGQAEERVSNVEISLVLDISGSMRGSKISTLRGAAQDFVDTVLRDEVENLVSLSLIPYTAQVNAGPGLLSQINLTEIPRHNYSHCLEFTADDFGRLGLHSSRQYRQGQHFTRYEYGPYNSGINNPSCPKRTYERIIPVSQDRNELKTAISQLQARHNTAIHTGMKWATVLLDPASQPMIANLSANPVGGVTIDSAFANRPAPRSDTDTKKFVILMTDGVNVASERVRRHYYDTEQEIDRWDRYGAYGYANAFGGYWGNYVETDYTASQANSRLNQICTLAKANDIIVFTIGFEVNNTSANIMRNCASTAAHFFRVEGTEINKAFDTIASQINELRLTL